MEFRNLLFNHNAGIAYLTFNRPGNINSMNQEMMVELGQALDMIEDDSKMKVIILTSAGRAFSAGFGISPKTGVVDIAIKESFRYYFN